jgi:CBS domain-containing protein
LTSIFLGCLGIPRYRPDTLAKELVQRLREVGARAALVTDAEGVLVGVLHRHEAEPTLQPGE